MAKNNKGQEVNDQRVNHSGRGRNLSMGRLLPPDWEWVRVTRTRYDDNNVWLHIRRLEIREAD